MSWIVEQIDKVSFLDKELEHINDVLILAQKKNQNNTKEYALLLQEKELLIKYKQCLIERIKLYCSKCDNCTECHDTTVHLVLGT